MNSNPASPVRVIAIDGPAGSGKSQTAKGLAQVLGYEHLDSGSLFRIMTLFCLNEGVNPEHDPRSVITIAENNIHRIEMKKSIAHLDGRRIGHEIRTAHIDNNVRFVSEIPEVRHLVTGLQRSCINNVGLVAEGRDMTSVVFMDAVLKIYLTADANVRAARRYEERRLKGERTTMVETYASLLLRDERDMKRACCPLIRVPEAFLIESDHMSLDGVIKLIEGIWLSRLSILDRYKAVA